MLAMCTCLKKRPILLYCDINVFLLSTARLKPKQLYCLIKPIIKWKTLFCAENQEHHIKQAQLYYARVLIA